jgi:hypothetical protein
VAGFAVGWIDKLMEYSRHMPRQRPRAHFESAKYLFLDGQVGFKASKREFCNFLLQKVLRVNIPKSQSITRSLKSSLALRLQMIN